MAKLSKENREALNKAQALLEEATTLVQEVRDELRDEFEGKSERWQESEAGESASARLDDLDAIEGELENAASSLSGVLEA